jgi:hypothetical protein
LRGRIALLLFLFLKILVFFFLIGLQSRLVRLFILRLFLAFITIFDLFRFLLGWLRQDRLHAISLAVHASALGFRFALGLYGSLALLFLLSGLALSVSPRAFSWVSFVLLKGIFIFIILVKDHVLGFFSVTTEETFLWHKLIASGSFGHLKWRILGHGTRLARL